MRVQIVEKNGFNVLEENELGKYLNKGDVFLPKGTGWEYRVINKVLLMEDGEYYLKVMVKKL